MAAEWGRAFLLSFGVIFGILLLEDVFNNLKDLLDFGAGLGEILRYYLVLTPSLLPTVIPVSFLVSVLASLGNLHRHGEVIAMRGLGMSLWRITRPLWAAATTLAAVVFLLNAEWVPWSVEESRRIWENQSFSHQAGTASPEEIGVVHNLAFHNGRDGRLWFINRFSEYTLRAYGITLSRVDGNLRESERIVAREGYFDDIAGHWVLQDGRRMTVDQPSGEVVRSIPFADLSLPEVRDDPTLMRFLEKRPSDLSFRELSWLLEMLPPSSNPRARRYQVQYLNSIATPFYCLFAVGLGIPFAVAGVRVNPMVGTSKAVILFFAYYVVSSLAAMLGTRAAVGPWVAVAVPPAIMLLLSIHFYRKAV